MKKNSTNHYPRSCPHMSPQTKRPCATASHLCGNAGCVPVMSWNTGVCNPTGPHGVKNDKGPTRSGLQCNTAYREMLHLQYRNFE
ncbi:hypothetical protein TSAR_014079, partial [Trichomalopsis sarcophagae]